MFRKLPILLLDKVFISNRNTREKCRNRADWALKTHLLRRSVLQTQISEAEVSNQRGALSSSLFSNTEDEMRLCCSTVIVLTQKLKLIHAHVWCKSVGGKEHNGAVLFWKFNVSSVNLFVYRRFNAFYQNKRFMLRQTRNFEWQQRLFNPKPQKKVAGFTREWAESQGRRSETLLWR